MAVVKRLILPGVLLVSSACWWQSERPPITIENVQIAQFVPFDSASTRRCGWSGPSVISPAGAGRPIRLRLQLNGICDPSKVRWEFTGGVVFNPTSPGCPGCYGGTEASGADLIENGTQGPDPFMFCVVIGYPYNNGEPIVTTPPIPAEKTVERWRIATDFSVVPKVWNVHAWPDPDDPMCPPIS